MKTIQISDFGRLKSGKRAHLYTMTNDEGMSAAVTDYGASLVKLLVPDKNEELTDVVLGYDNAAGYEKGEESIGATVGRNANRIAKASLVIDGKEYKLDKNDNGNNLHSGKDYYHKRLWTVEEYTDDSVTFLLHSPDGDQGYPGSIDMRVTYELDDNNDLRIIYDAAPDAATVINMTNHSYFNLDGHDSGNILRHVVSVDADYYTEADAESIPTGELIQVKGTPMDFREGRVIGKDINADYEAIRLGHGYDHNWVLKNDGKFEKVAKVVSAKSGIVMEVSTDLPGMQIYTGNFLNNENGKDGAVYTKHAGVCFETQYFPDAVHHDQFAAPIFREGESYYSETSYRFSLIGKEEKEEEDEE